MKTRALLMLAAVLLAALPGVTRAQRMYWVDGEPRTLRSAVLDGTDVRDIASSIRIYPNSLVLHPLTGDIYWPGAVRAQTFIRGIYVLRHGSSVPELIVSTDAYGLALDQDAG